ncbi:MAG: NAD(P)H-dependent oxidoreductase [Flavobacteriales bacterium]|nr:NAD(P)H-dependent oxidoreductase [Flavobacteriales bacterium]
MKKIIAFSGSNSSQSINQQLVNATAQMIDGVEVIDLRDYDAPIYGIDLETESGIPANITKLIEKLAEADAYIVSTPEHNSLIPAFLKNILDWMSRTGAKPFGEKPLAVLSTSPGGGGAAKAAAVLEKVLPYLGADVKGVFNLPAFGSSFDAENTQISDLAKKEELQTLLSEI